jgi:ABC-2 type transport system ATP-binding protein
MSVSNTNHQIIIANGLTKRFGDFTAVNKVYFEVHRGEIFGFLGPNGSGKTTTIRMALGLLSPSEGEIRVMGINIDHNTSRIRQHIGYMSQRFSLYNDLTVLQNLQFYGTAYGLSRSDLDKRIQDALEMSGLVGREHSKTKDLSGGWRQRLALSASILHEPELIFLDEPTAGVDPVSRRAFWDLLYQQVNQGVTVFVTTHYMDEAEHCHRLAFIQHGTIIAYGTPQEIKAEKMDRQVLEIEPSDPIESMKILQKVKDDQQLPIEQVELYGSLVHVVAPKIENYQVEIEQKLKRAGILMQSMSVIEPSLEDVFISSMK